MSLSCSIRPGRVAALSTVFCLAIFAGCSKNGDPYDYVKVSGTVTYEDGSHIPASSLVLSFIPQTPAVSAKARPKAGMCYPDMAAGRFDAVTSHTANDGVVRGKHKVTVTDQTHHPLPSSVVPIIYSDPDKTPLEVDTDHLPWELKISKP